MDPYHTSQLPPPSSFLSQNFDNDDSSDPSSAFMKAPKRKRLAKACDACHKSKRRCDGTAPCSNCYYASKACSYTDASGRPVPAPRPFKPERTEPVNDHRNAQPSASSSSSVAPLSQDRDHSEGDPRQSQNNEPQNNIPRKRFRNERGNAIATEDISAPLPLPNLENPITSTIERPRPVELDHSLTRELTNLFFTHCHPARAIIHKPTFSASLAHNRVPLHLLHAVCALAAPLSKQPRLRTTPSRFAGKPFAQEALAIMFDGAGRLVCERNLATAQALCLLQVHDVATKDKNMSWNSGYHDLALQIVESLNVYQHEYPTLTPVPSPEFIQASIEREAVRRIFWLIHLMDIMASIFFKKPMISLRDRGMRLRLPADETSFELGVHSTLPEYLYLPAVRTQYSSEFGHLIRVITIYSKVDAALDELSDPETASSAMTALNEAEETMEFWLSSLSEHLRFSEQNLEVQLSMFETSSNTGAWCWCCMHVFHASSVLALNLAKQRSQRAPKTDSHWALRTLDLIMNMLGDRAKNSILMGAALWGFIKYGQRDDAQIRTWCAEYEDSWGSRMMDLALDCRPNPSPHVQHQYLPVPQQQQTQSHHPQQQHRRITEVRNPPVSGARPASHQHDSSYNRRSPGSSSPTSLPVGRPLEEIRLHSSNNTRNMTLHLHSPHSDRDTNGRGHAGPGGVGMGMVHGGKGGEKEREQEVNLRRPAHDPDIDPALQNGIKGVSLGGRGGDSGGQRGVGTGGDGSQSLPSLKSSGLLDSWGPSGNAQHTVGHGGNGAQRTSPPHAPHPPHEGDGRSTVLVSMPVGLQWLANESR